MILEIKDISISFGGIVAVDGCNFSVKEGEITCLIGPNGAGKTTIFNMITGFLKTKSGSIVYKGKEITHLKPEKIVGLGIARTFQNLRLFNEMSVLENVMISKLHQKGESVLYSIFRRNLLKKEEMENRERAERILEYVGLDKKKNEITDNLSYAEQKLLTIARLLMTEADLLLLDEPASGLDKHSLDFVLPLIKDLKKRGKTILLIEHNMDIIKSVADKVVFLNQGKVLGIGSAEEIMGNEQLTEIYFGGGSH